MFTEFAMSGREIAQEIRAKELFDDFMAAMKPCRKVKEAVEEITRSTGHGLGPIMRFKGLT